MKILFVTHSAVLPTGMAETTRLIFNSLLDRYPGSYELHQLGLLHIQAVTRVRWPICATNTGTVLDEPSRFLDEDLHGECTVRKLFHTLRPDIIFGFNDPQHLLHLCTDASERGHKLVLYFNIDGFPIPRGYYERLLNADRLVVSSEFGRRAFLRSYPQCDPGRIEVMYSPADTSRFVPVSQAEKTELRQDLAPPWMPTDAFILGWVGMNQWRKQVWIPYQIIHLLRTGAYLRCSVCRRIGLLNCESPLSFPVSGAPRSGRRSGVRDDKCPYCGSAGMVRAQPIDDIFLWLQMPSDAQNGTWPADLLERLYDVRPGRDLYYTESCVERQQLAPEDVPTLYQLWDALLYLSGGEGFGLPPWEAMSAGLPVVYSNYSSHAEFLQKADAGLPVGGVLQPEGRTCICRCIASVPQALEAILKLYRDRDLRLQLGRNGRAFTQSYNTDIQAEKWHRLFQECVRG